jgi:NAD(P)H-hydrate repair Nnr-like enzyme with NAD(P)H-hydrate epimerase domain
MTELLTAAQMRAVEQAAIDSGEVTGLELMERAGRGVVEAVLEEWPELALTSHKAVVLCGPGNNGGDGFVVARLLKERGWEVEVFFYGEEGKLAPDALANYQRWGELGPIQPLSSDNCQTWWDGYSLHTMLSARHLIVWFQLMPQAACVLIADDPWDRFTERCIPFSTLHFIGRELASILMRGHTIAQKTWSRTLV